MFKYPSFTGEDAADGVNDSSQTKISGSPPKLAKKLSKGETLSWKGTSDGVSSEEDSYSSEAPLSSGSSDGAASEPPLKSKAFFRHKVGQLFGSRRIKEELCCCLQRSHQD